MQPPNYYNGPGPYQQQQPVYYVQQTQEPPAKPKNETMKTFSILSFIAFIVLIGGSGLTAQSISLTVGGIFACGGLFMFTAGFIFLCLI